jgi:hypothetical protein
LGAVVPQPLLPAALPLGGAWSSLSSALAVTGISKSPNKISGISLAMVYFLAALLVILFMTFKNIKQKFIYSYLRVDEVQD